MSFPNSVRPICFPLLKLDFVVLIIPFFRSFSCLSSSKPRADLRPSSHHCYSTFQAKQFSAMTTKSSSEFDLRHRLVKSCASLLRRTDSQATNGSQGITSNKSHSSTQSVPEEKCEFPSTDQRARLSIVSILKRVIIPCFP